MKRVNARVCKKTYSGVVKKNSALGDKVAMKIFQSAVPALIERWERYKQDENTDITFDRFLINIMNEYEKKGV